MLSSVKNIRHHTFFREPLADHSIALSRESLGSDLKVCCIWSLHLAECTPVILELTQPGVSKEIGWLTVYLQLCACQHLGPSTGDPSPRFPAAVSLSLAGLRRRDDSISSLSVVHGRMIVLYRTLHVSQLPRSRLQNRPAISTYPNQQLTQPSPLSIQQPPRFQLILRQWTSPGHMPK